MAYHVFEESINFYNIYICDGLNSLLKQISSLPIYLIRLANLWEVLVMQSVSLWGCRRYIIWVKD